MTDQPLTSNEQSSIIVFAILLLPAALFVVGFIPSILLLYGLFMMKRNGEFTYIEVMTKVAKLYFYAGAVIGFFFLIFFLATYNDIYNEEHFFSALGVFISLLYARLITTFFYNPLERHKDWVLKNGIFRSTNTSMHSEVDANIDIVKNGKLGAYSVADELIKWAKLKEDGHVSEADYEKAKNGLLNK